MYKHTIQIYKDLLVFVAWISDGTRLPAPEGGVSILGLLFHYWLRADRTLQPPPWLRCIGAGHGWLHECHRWTRRGTHESERAGARFVRRATWCDWNPGCLATCIPDRWRTTCWSWAADWVLGSLLLVLGLWSPPTQSYSCWVCGLIIFEDFGYREGCLMTLFDLLLSPSLCSAAYALRPGVAFSVHDFQPFKKATVTDIQYAEDENSSEGLDWWNIDDKSR